MKKVIPIIIVLGFLMVGCFNPFINTTNINDDSTSISAGPSLTVANPTSNDDQMDNNPPSGSRFMVTTRTALSLDKPRPNENFTYGDLIEVSGYLFEDNNSNGVFDIGQDIPVPLAKVKIEFGDYFVERETDEDGLFTWSTFNEMTVKGLWDMKITYDGQYTINGSEWYDVDTSSGGNGRLFFNEDNDYYIDCDLFYNISSSAYEYRFPGDGKFTPGVVDIGASKRIGGDVIIRDNGQRTGIWDSGDERVRDPLNEGDAPFGVDDQIMNYYTNPGQPHPDYGYRIDFTDPLIDEETPNTVDQVTFFQVWADDDGDWKVGSHDNGEDGQPGTSDPGEGDGWPTPGEKYVDEDLNFTKFRHESNMTVWLNLWHNTEINAIVLNKTGKQTNKAIVGEEITIKGTLIDKVNQAIKPANKPLKLKIFGNFISELQYTDNKGEFSYTYTVPDNQALRVGQRDIDIIFNEKIYDENYNEANASHQHLMPTSLSNQDSGPLSIRIYRPIHIDFDKSKYTGYRFKSLIINGTVLDDNDRPLYTSIIHDDGSTETLTTNAYKVKFEWGRPVDKYYKYREEELIDASGNFSISQIQINHPDQAMGDIPVTITIECNESQTYYLPTTHTITVIVRSKGAIDIWIDQDRDGFNDEGVTNTIRGQLADYITRTKFIDKDGNSWDFNNVIVYGRLFYRERPEDGINSKFIEYYWDDSDDTYTQSSQTATKDYNLNGRIEDDEEGRFIIPDPNKIEDPPKFIERSHGLGPITLHVKYDDPGDYIDPIEIKKEFNVVAMTEITIQPGGGVKGENLTITGRLKDDLGNGVADQNIKLYWEDLQGDLLVDDKYDPIKLADAEIGNVTTDKNGFFSFYSEKILKSDVDVGKGYVVAIFEGSEPPYSAENAFIGTSSNEVPFNVSAHTKVELDSAYSNLRMIRGKSFTVEGTIHEVYKEDKNLDAKVILGIADADQMELYIKNYDQTEETRITNIRVEYKSEGRFTITGVVPFNLDVGTATLRMVFKGSKNGYYLEDQETTFHEIWADTVIKILAPRYKTREIEEEGYVLDEDIRQEKYDSNSDDFDAPGLIFRFQLIEKTESGEPKPVEGGKITLIINSSFSVFTNYSYQFTDEVGIVNFTFNKPLTDTDWGYTLAKTEPEELLISVEFAGMDYYISSKALPIQTTHWPPEKEKDIPWLEREETQRLIWIIVIIIIVFLIAFFFAMQWYSKQQRIRGMRRIIKRAADQLIAGNEYQAVIFKSYQKLGVHLRKYGYLRRDSETFREFEDAVRSALPIDRMSMDKFLHLLEEARYSSHQIGEKHRNNAILNLRAIERSLDRIIIDEDAALRALERLEEDGVKETKILVGKGGPTQPQNVPQLLKGAGPAKSKPIQKGQTGNVKPGPPK